MSTPASFTCLALSPAGRVPTHGRNNYHVYEGNAMYSTGWYCDESKTQAGSWDGGPEFNAQYWNRRHQANGLDAPAGWRWGELSVEHVFMGGRETILRKHFVGFYTEHPDIYVGGCMIDRPRYIHDLRVLDLTRRQIFDLTVPKLKGPGGSYVYASESYCTDGTRWPVLNASLMAYKYVNLFEQLLP